MQQSEAIYLIQKTITGDQPQHWAELGSGSGTFTLALQKLLPTGSHLTAVDKQAQKLPVSFIKADFEKDDLDLDDFDGILMANSLHYVRDQAKLIKKLEACFSTMPTFLIVEYNTERASPWVPYPINCQNLLKLFTTLNYTSITQLANLPSRFGGQIYSALIRL